MFSKYITISAALLAITSAAPIAKRDGCVEGTYNCIDGTHFAQCVSGGTWSVTMPVAQGTTCNKGISINPFLPVEGGSTAPPADNPPPPPSQPSTAPSAPPAPPAPQPTEPSSPPSPPPPSQTSTPPKNDPPPPPAQTTAAPAPPAPTGTNNGAGLVPDINSWLSFDAMKAKYVNVMGTSCEASGWGANNSPEETQQVLSAIESLHGSVDPRFLLALTIQESSGCVRVITTNNGVRNPGLLQDSNGAHTCNDAGVVQNPCPVSQINGMIQDGISGGSNNLQSALATASKNNFGGAMAYAVAARIYNSGSFDPTDLNNGLGSTASYVQNIMDRLTGAKL